MNNPSSINSDLNSAIQGLPILTEIIKPAPSASAKGFSKAQSPAPGNRPPASSLIQSAHRSSSMRFLSPSKVKSNREVPMRLQRSKINFLQPMQNQQQHYRRLHGFWPQRSIESSLDMTLPPPIVQPQHTAIARVGEDAPSLLNLFSDQPERDWEKQIVQLAEERAAHRAQAIIAQAWEFMQESILEEVQKILPEIIAQKVQAEKPTILQNSTTRFMQTLDHQESLPQSVKTQVVASLTAATNAPKPALAALPPSTKNIDETRIVEDQTMTAPIAQHRW